MSTTVFGHMGDCSDLRMLRLSIRPYMPGPPTNEMIIIQFFPHDLLSKNVSLRNKWFPKFFLYNWFAGSVYVLPSLVLKQQK
jgi:hypothetical protein